MIGKRGFTVGSPVILGVVGLALLVFLITCFVMGGGGSPKTEEVHVALPDNFPQ